MKAATPQNPSPQSKTWRPFEPAPSAPALWTAVTKVTALASGNGRRRSRRAAMKELRPMGGQIEVEPLLFQIIAAPHVAFRPQQVAHFPVVPSKTGDGQGRTALTAMVREVDDRQVKL